MRLTFYSYTSAWNGGLGLFPIAWEGLSNAGIVSIRTKNATRTKNERILIQFSLSNEKPSAIFKINANTANTDVIDLDNQMIDDDTPVEQFDITVGISIEPLDAVQNQQAIVKSETVPPTEANAVVKPQDIAVLANKIVQHAYNFLSGFTTPDGKVPMKAFDDWWAKFKHKLEMNPKFLDNLD